MASYSPERTSALAVTDLDLHPETLRSLQVFRNRRGKLLAIRGLLIAFFVAMVAFALIAAVDYFLLLADRTRWLMTITAYVVAIGCGWKLAWSQLSESDPRKLARRLQAGSPRLRDDLLSAVELADPDSVNGSQALRDNLQRRVGQRLSTIDIRDVLPASMLQKWAIVAAAVTILLLILFVIPTVQMGRRFARAALPGLAIERASLTRVQIMEPSPPGRFVAAGDAVGIVASINGRPADEVVIRQRILIPSDPEHPEGRIRSIGRVTEIQMSERAVADVTSQYNGHDGLFAANINVGSQPVEYQLVAGDAITLWHRLIPIPRPKVIGFDKLYQPPVYAQIDESRESSESGELKALLGSTAEVTVHFDQPVRDATLRYSGSGFTAMEPVDEQKKTYRTTVPIKTPSSYQVTATSLRSGLGNPFSRQHAIIPVPDAPPKAHWGPTVKRLQLASPMQVLPLTGTATDDLPIDRLVHEFRINQEPWQRIDYDYDSDDAQRIRTKTWDWDLLHPDGDNTVESILKPGDRLISRFAAVDRRGQRADSKELEILIVDEGFDPLRHQSLDEHAAWAIASLDIISHYRSAFDRDIAAMKAADWVDEEGRRQAISILRSIADDARETTPESDTAIAKTGELLEDTAGLMHSRPLAQVATAILFAANRRSAFSTALADRLDLVDDATDLSDTDRRCIERMQRSFQQTVREQRGTMSSLEELVRGHLEQHLSIHRLRDMNAFAKSLRFALNDDQQTDDRPPIRWDRFLRVMNGRLRELDELVEPRLELVQPRSQGFFNQAMAFTSHWQDRIATTLESKPDDAASRRLATEFLDQLDQQIRHRIIEGSIPDTSSRVGRQVDAASGPSWSLAEQLVAFLKETRSDDDRALLLPIAGANMDFIDLREAVHRERVPFDPDFAADLNLVRKAIENIVKGWPSATNDDASQPTIADKPYQQMKQVADAMRILESRAMLADGLELLSALEVGESDSKDLATMRIQHAVAIAAYPSMIELPHQHLGRVDAVHQTPSLNAANQDLDKTRYNQAYQVTKERISRRLWQNKSLVSATAALGTNAAIVRDNLAILQPVFEDARQVLQRYVRSLSEIARNAADKTDAARDLASQRTQDQSPTDEQSIKDAVAEAFELSEETVAALVDEANRADLITDSQRERARDADAAASLIQDALDDAKEANRASVDSDDAEDVTSAAMNELADRLRQASQHFDEDAASEQTAHSRQQLRDDAAQLDSAGEMQDEQTRTESLANAAKQDPERLLERLEQALADDKIMQDELGNIAEDAVADAEQLFRDSADAEEQIVRDLERSDAAFYERKLRLSQQIQMTGRSIQGIRNAFLEPSRTASERGKDPTSRVLTEQAIKQLTESASTASKAGPHLSAAELDQIAAQVDEAVQQAEQQIASAANVAMLQSNQDIHGNADRRDSAAKQAAQDARNSRNREKQEADRANREWLQRSRQASTRLQQNQRLQRDTKNQLRGLESQQKKKPQDWLASQIDELIQKLVDAEAAEQSFKDTRDEFRAFSDAAKQNAADVAKKPIGDFDKQNPSSQAADEFLRDAIEGLQGILETLGSAARDTVDADSLRAPQQSAQNAIERQERIESNLAEASEMIDRAGRHESRLDMEELAQQLASAAETSKETATAGDKLRDAANQAEMSPEATKASMDAAKTMRAQADELNQMLADLTLMNGSEQTSPSPSDSPSSERGSDPNSTASEGESDPAAQSRKLAKTLDELDRAVNSPSASSQGQDSEASPSGEDGESTPSPNAMQSSPTLARAVQSQRQKLAQKRQDQFLTSPLPKTAGEPGQGSTSASAESSVASDESNGRGEMPDGKSVDGSGLDRSASSAVWGQLREQRSEDVVADKTDSIAPQYRADVEAYFRAIAAQSQQESL